MLQTQALRGLGHLVDSKTLHETREAHRHSHASQPSRLRFLAGGEDAGTFATGIFAFCGRPCSASLAPSRGSPGALQHVHDVIGEGLLAGNHEAPMPPLHLPLHAKAPARLSDAYVGAAAAEPVLRVHRAPGSAQTAEHDPIAVQISFCCQWREKSMIRLPSR